jgi:hypothetical protein
VDVKYIVVTVPLAVDVKNLASVLQPRGNQPGRDRVQRHRLIKSVAADIGIVIPPQQHNRHHIKLKLKSVLVMVGLAGKGQISGVRAVNIFILQILSRTPKQVPGLGGNSAGQQGDAAV